MTEIQQMIEERVKLEAELDHNYAKLENNMLKLAILTLSIETRNAMLEKMNEKRRKQI